MIQILQFFSWRKFALTMSFMENSTNRHAYFKTIYTVGLAGSVIYPSARLLNQVYLSLLNVVASLHSRADCVAVRLGLPQGSAFQTAAPRLVHYPLGYIHTARTVRSLFRSCSP